MRFIVDAQLPPALARQLASAGEDAVHVLDVGLLDADDAEIWAFALDQNRAIITKDEDFQIRASVSAIAPPILWVRFGNSSKQQVLDVFNRKLEAIKREFEAGATLVELI